MLCPTCQTESRRFGKDRYGNQRFQCAICRKTFSDRPTEKPLAEMRLPLDKALLCLKLLTEGNSVLSTVRITGVAKRTVLALLVMAGQRCERMMEERIRGLKVKEVQADELWSYVGMKQKTKNRRYPNAEGVGDCWCYVAIEKRTKLILTWHLGQRDAMGALGLMEGLDYATNRGRFQLTTDGFPAYPLVVNAVFSQPVDFAQLVKVYGKAEDDHRYSPATVIDTYTVNCCGNPDPKKICTSHVERQNLTMRMQVRRLTRLTNGFSKKWANHRAAIALHFAQYNFCRVHSTIKMTPAMKAGLADHPWSLAELLQEAAKSTH